MIKQKLFKFNIIERTEDDVTPRAGIIMYDGFMRALKMDKIVNSSMPASGSNRGYDAWKYVRPVSQMQYGGGRHISDLRELRQDKTLQRSGDIDNIPSDSAVGDWLLRMGKGGGIEGMDRVHREAIIKLIKLDKKNEEYTLWADPTIIELGDKDYAEMLYTGQEGDRPMLVGLKELPIFVHHKYRRGNAMGGTKEAVQRAIDVVEAAGKKIKHIALDSEFYTSEVINYIEGKGITYTIVADKDKAVKESIKRIEHEGWKPYYDAEGIKTDREIAVTVHAMDETESFTLVVLRWKKEQLNLLEPDKYFYHAIATNMDVDAGAAIKIHNESVPDTCRAVWQYNERSQMENHIKELKIGMGMEQMPCGEFEANAMYFSIGVLTYNLMVAQKYFVIQEGFEKSTIGTLRWKLVQIAAWITEHSNRIRLKIATSLEKFNHYVRMIRRMEKIAALPC